MQQNYMSNWSAIMSNMQKPLQEMMELNTRTLQNISYLKPEDLSKIRKPEELMERQINVFVENGHKALDYMQKTFAIFEKSLMSISRDVKEQTEANKQNWETMQKKFNEKRK
ncbi:phasin family protein [Legionella cardiaca]|uniref:Phasin family protein n=1 Tax=Legionella cardiaca TaxID=1071983 RepID=A0ABY8ASX8_9GAMM|nr:phasin family protein [Legionella cardiaca]WED42879.1 phasin family protein [Legionella cardiaca]